MPWQTYFTNDPRFAKLHELREGRVAGRPGWVIKGTALVFGVVAVVPALLAILGLLVAGLAGIATWMVLSTLSQLTGGGVSPTRRGEDADGREGVRVVDRGPTL